MDDKEERKLTQPDSEEEEETETSENQEKACLTMEKETPSSKNNNEYKAPETPAAKVFRLLSTTEGEEPEKGGGGSIVLTPHSLFTQLDVLVHFEDGKKGWKEMARWLKYEETVEVGDRWSKPHVPTAQMHALLELRKAFADGRCATGLGVTPLKKGQYQIADAVIETLKKESQLSDSLCQKILATVIQPHKHKHRNKGSSKSPENGEIPKSMTDATLSSASDDDDDPTVVHSNGVGEKKKKKFLRRRSGQGQDIASVYHNYPPGTKPDNLAPYKPNKRLSKKLPKGCESANILVGQVHYLREPVMAFIRLNESSVMADLTEVDVPLRFLLLILGPPNETNIWEFQEMGRAMAAMLNDKVFCEVAYKATTTQDLVAGIDEFLDDLTVLPPSIWDPSMRLDPPKQTRSMDKIMLRFDETKRRGAGPTAPPQEEGASDDTSLKRTGRIFGGLINDVKHRYSYFLSDFKDGLHIQCVASTVFLFFACITPIVTFGGLMGQKTDGYMGTMETLMSGAICGFLYALFAGQPLTIVGATGPLLIFESILYYLCKENDLDFMSFRFWIGFWVMVALLVIVAFDLSALVQYITRFTEESFAILISVIFIYEAFTKIAEIYHHTPVHQGVVREDPGFLCFCVPSDFVGDPLSHDANGWNSTTAWFNSTDFNDTETRAQMSDYPEECITLQQRIEVNSRCISEKECTLQGWNLTGPACGVPAVTQSVADVFFLSLILFLGTFSLAYFFRVFRNMRIFPSRVRSTVADFAVFLSVVTFTLIDFGFGVDTPKLNVPEEFVTTRRDRGWIVNPLNTTYWWLIPLSIIPAILATILVFLDQQITSVIINRKEHKLKKGHGYHLDLFVLAFLILICSIVGLPWFVAATVRAITHVKSLMRESEVSVPGERPQVVGVREQRVTGICIHLLIGFSTLLTSILRLIPMPVLYGVFLYMGITSLGGVQFIQRIGIMLMPVKYQPDLIYLRHVKTMRVHLFTAVQLACFIGMWVVKQIKLTSIAFPVMLIVLMVARKCLDFVFTQGELYWLDHLLPEEHRRHREDTAKALEEGGLNSHVEMKALGIEKQPMSKEEEAKSYSDQSNLTRRK